MNCVGIFFSVSKRKKKTPKPSIFNKAKFKKGQEWHDTCQVQRVRHSLPPHTPKKNKLTDSSKIEPRLSSIWTIGRLAVRHKPTTLRNL